MAMMASSSTPATSLNASAALIHGNHDHWMLVRGERHYRTRMPSFLDGRITKSF